MVGNILQHFCRISQLAFWSPIENFSCWKEQNIEWYIWGSLSEVETNCGENIILRKNTDILCSSFNCIYIYRERERASLYHVIHLI